ncbi:MAG: hypothetical protein ACHQ4H_14845 [Ktedonobacterales bacterium]
MPGMHAHSRHVYSDSQGHAHNPDALTRRGSRLARARASLAAFRPAVARIAWALAAAGGPMDGPVPESPPGGMPARTPLARRLRGWLPTARDQSRGPVSGMPAPWFRAARRWSPGIVPPALALLLLAALALAGHQSGRGPALVPPQAVLPLFLIYLIGGTVYGIALYYAPTNSSWLAVLAGGALLYVFATLWALAGPVAVAILGILLAVPTYLYVRGHLHTVADGNLLVTTLAGGYHRTIAPGTAVLIPGERMLATVDTADRQFACPTQRMRVSDRDGGGYIARAAATLAYHVAPGAAHLAALASDHWERDLQEAACGTLRHGLDAWARRMLDGDELPERFLAKTVLHDLREQARANGIAILWLSVRDIWLNPESEVIPVGDWDNDAEPEARAPHPAAQPLNARLPETSAALPPIAEARATLSSEPLEPEALAPDALSDAYDAVREGTIRDPDTIREIARAFLRVANDPEINDQFPYDAVAAAQILMDRAATLERAATEHGAR